MISVVENRDKVIQYLEVIDSVSSRRHSGWLPIVMNNRDKTTAEGIDVVRTLNPDYEDLQFHARILADELDRRPNWTTEQRTLLRQSLFRMGRRISKGVYFGQELTPNSMSLFVSEWNELVAEVSALFMTQDECPDEKESEVKTVVVEAVKCPKCSGASSTDGTAFWCSNRGTACWFECPEEHRGNYPI